MSGYPNPGSGGGGGASVGSPYISNWGQLITIPVTDFGAKFDNSTDDTAAIQAALNAAAPNPYSQANINDRPSIIVQMPPGRAIITSALLMPANVWLRGHGPSGTYLCPSLATLTDNYIQLATGAEVQVYLTDFGIIGRTLATAGAAIDLTQTSQSSLLGDARHIISNIVIDACWNGVHCSGNTEVRLDRITVQRADNDGITTSGTDMYISNCTIGQPGVQGILLQGGNSRVWGCKVFGGGAGNTGVAAFSVGGSGRHQIAACEIQDFNGAGMSIGGNNVSTVSAVLIDSCAAGFNLNAGVGTARLDGAVVYRSGGAYIPAYGLLYSGVSQQVAHISVQDGTGSNPLRELSIGGTNASGDVVVNRQLGYQNVTYASSITPNPYEGGTVFVTLTGDIAVGAPANKKGSTGATNFLPGCMVSFEFTQDSGGGHAVSWDASFVFPVAWTNTGNTASTRSRATFQFDGANWICTSNAANVWF